jgi:hypothetical protein
LRSFAIAFLAAASVLAAIAPAAADSRPYPIHYDGPMVIRSGLSFDTHTDPNYRVKFHGGPVQITTQTFNIYWKPDGTFMAPGYELLMNRFLKDVGGSAIYGVGTEYSGNNGQVQNVSTFGGEWTDRTGYPSRITDADLQVEISKAIAANGWPVGLGSQFFIYTSKNAPVSGGFCAYHSAYDLGGRKFPVIYGFIPYVGYLNGCDPPYFITPNNNIDADGSIISVSHEQMEMVSDPLINAWYGIGGEIGDICIFSFGDPFGKGGANLMIHGNPYIVQEIWSQSMQGCQPSL